MKKMKGIFIILPIMVMSFLIGIVGVKADSYELKMVPYNVTGVCDLEGDEENYGGDLCFERYLKGELEPYLIKDNIVKEGQTIMLVQKLVPSSDSKLVLIQYSIKHDVSKAKYYSSSERSEYGILYDDLGYSYGSNGASNTDTYYPFKSTARSGKWKSANPYIDSVDINGVIEDFNFNAGSDELPLIKETPLSATYYTINETDSMEGYDIKFEYADDVSSTTLAGKDEILDNKRTLIPLTLKVLSKDGTLSELKAIGNNRIDYLENKFIPSSINNLEYNLSVPNSIETITFNGTTTSSVKGINGLNTINNLSNGANIFNISITAANGEITLYKININKMEDDNISNLITSSTYEINRFENSQNGEVNHVIGLEPKTTLKEFKSKFDNPYSALHVYDKNGNELTNESAYVGTKMVVKLINGNNIVDVLTIVVRGDLWGNGVINYSDRYKMFGYILKGDQFDYIEIQAADLNKDNYVTVVDYTAIGNYLWKNILTVN